MLLPTYMETAYLATILKALDFPNAVFETQSLD